VSDQSIRNYCQHLDWTTTDMIGLSGPYCLEALATIVEMRSDCTKAELAIACPLACRQRGIISGLIVSAMDVGLGKYRRLIVQREFAHPDFVAELRDSEHTITWKDEIEICSRR
jgi:hypothetical protein